MSTRLSLIVSLVVLNFALSFPTGVDEWMDDLRFNVLVKSISAISGRLAGGNKKLYAMEHRLRFRRR